MACFSLSVLRKLAEQPDDFRNDGNVPDIDAEAEYSGDGWGVFDNLLQFFDDLKGAASDVELDHSGMFSQMPHVGEDGAVSNRAMDVFGVDGN